MNYISAHRTVSGWPFFCLLLTLFTTSLAAQATFCPPYPRAIDQAYVCVVAKNGFQLELEQRATLHSPVRFVFPGFALTPQLTITSLSIDFGDGLGSRTITSGSTVSVVYPTSNTQYTLTYSVNIIGDGTSNTWDGTIIYQNNANPDVNYSSEAPDETWGDLTGNTFTPPSDAYPPGSTYALPATAGGLVHIKYANADKKMRKPFILVEGFDPIITPANEYAVNRPDGSLLGYGSVRCGWHPNYFIFNILSL